ncbi:uberolysin/carnocyclin family circular bacteriocin [Evansella sp. AB-P1]|uniref:uberolysin/carnocyclin family circular bacteriocin n=1 Tax=Evansella sp. AB-P1 TaxID=3037653 RepID=UPI00241CC59C|nr:uberolysin/carnocyclin family circular bacteriocin [Evansella sp. AB-P1]MDG5790189.1 uberolysin/carnocyclin family circular bacteriocin [Evansella sp. AB-P1]
MEMIKGKKRVLSISFLCMMAFLLMASSVFLPANNSSQSVTTNVAVAEYEASSAELQLARVINNHTKYTWNQSQSYASRIVNMVMVGSDIAAAVSIVLGFLSFGVVTAITWAARMSLKWYINRKGRREAVLW